MQLNYTKWLLFILTISLFVKCSPKSIPSSAKVNYVSSIDGTITMSCIGIGANKKAAISDAEKNAFAILLFRGVPESEQKIALIGTNIAEEEQKHPTYFNNFYKGQQYKTFLMSSIPTSELINKTNITVEVKINVTALRKDLEQNNIIRKFGY